MRAAGAVFYTPPPLDIVTNGFELVLDIDYDAEPDSEEEDDEPVNRNPTQSKYSFEQMQRIAEMRKKGCSFATIQGKFRRLNSMKEVDRWVSEATAAAWLGLHPRL